MIQVILNVLLMTFTLYLVDSQLLENNKNRNIIMFCSTTLVCLGLCSFIAYTLNFQSTSNAAVILIPLSLLVGLWVGFRDKILSLIK